MAVVAQRWFAERRGLVLGLMTASSATGQLVFLPVLASLAEQLGWRAVSLALAAVTLAMIPLVAFVLRDRPADLGLSPYGATTIETTEKAAVNPMLRAVRALGAGARSFDFWLLSGTCVVYGASTNGLIGTHSTPFIGMGSKRQSTSPAVDPSPPVGRRRLFHGVQASEMQALFRRGRI